MTILSSLVVKGVDGRTILSADDTGLKDESGRIVNAFVAINANLAAAPTSNYIWRCKYGVWQVESVGALVRASGGAGCTVDVLVCQGVEAVASGVSQLTAVMDTEETAPFQAVGALIAVPTQIFPGDSVAFAIGGTPTALIGLLTVILKRTT